MIETDIEKYYKAFIGERGRIKKNIKVAVQQQKMFQRN